MILDMVARELRAALEHLRSEHARLGGHIASVESVLAQLGAPVKRGPGRPKGSVSKHKRGRPKGSGKKAAPAASAASANAGMAIPPPTLPAALPIKRGRGRPKGSIKAKKAVLKKRA